jgi:hypothetical protein
MILSVLFFVNTRLFIHGVEQHYTGGVDRGNKTFESLGYSLVAVITSMVLAAMMMVAVLGHAGRRYTLGMPLDAACSAAISAARDAENGDLVLDRKARWGVVSETEGVGHCSFGMAVVIGLEKGKSYA